VAVADVDLIRTRFADLFGLGAGAADDDVELGQVEVTKGADALHREEFMHLLERTGQVLEAGGTNIEASKFWHILGHECTGVNRCVRECFVQGQDDLFGAAHVGQPIGYNRHSWRLFGGWWLVVGGWVH